MTIPPIELIKKLGPNFDYSSIERLRNSPAFAQLPQEMQDSINGLQKFGIDAASVANPAPRDRIGEGAFPTPPVTPTPPVDKFEDEAWSVVHMAAPAAGAAIGGAMAGPPGAILGAGAGMLSQLVRAYEQAKKGGSFEQALGQEQQRTAQTSSEFMHQLTAGLWPSPQVPKEYQAAFNTVVKPTTALMAVGLQGSLTFKAVGMLTKVPTVANVLEQLPQRLADVGQGATALGLVDAMRADGIPNDPSALDPSGYFAKKLASMGVPDRLALLASGSAVGGILGGSFLGIQRGMEWSRSINMARKLSPEALSSMQDALVRLGYTDVPGQSKVQILNRFVKAMGKVTHDEELAGLVSEQLSRESWVAQQLYGSAEIAPESEEARYTAALMRGHPGAVSVATNISDPSQVVAAQARLGLKMDMVTINRAKEGEPPAYDILMSRPKYEYPTFESAPRAIKRTTKIIADAASEAKRDLFAAQSEDVFVLPDGSTVRGGFSVDDLAKKIKPQAPVVDGVPRPDIGLKQAASMVNFTIKDNKLVVDLPERLTQEQFEALGPAANVTRFEQVVLKRGARQVVLDGPLGQQVQDAATTLVKPTKQSSALSSDLINQFKQTGHFDGQAAVLADGTPVAIEKKSGDVFQVRDPLTRTSIKVHQDQITPLPTSLEGEMSPSNMFTRFLSPSEQQAFAQLRVGVQAGLAEPVEKYSQLAKFGNSRGFLVDELGRGKYRISSATDGQGVTVSNLKAGVEFIRKNTAPMPDLTPDVIKKVLGNANTSVGFVFPTGAPLRVGELIPIPHDAMVKALEDNINGTGPGIFQSALRPSRGLFLDLDKKHGTQFYPLFENVQSRLTLRQNFQALWYDGEGGQLPNGITPLRKIIQIAGEDANQERLTDWLEASDKSVVEKMMTPGEKQAAPLLRKWYDGLFKEFGIEPDYVENYAPQLRLLAPQYGNNPGALVKENLTRLSKGFDFWADNYREGLLDVYDKDAFRVAMKYLNQGTSNRFMKEPMQQGVEYVSKLAQVNEPLAKPMAYFLQAIRGQEFSEQRLALSQSIEDLFGRLPGVTKQSQKNAADTFVSYIMGAIYTGTMGARPGMALRNIGNEMMMMWPIFPKSFLESIPMALTRRGMEEAAADGAISYLPSRAGAQEEIAGLPKMYQQMTEFGFHMYDSADEFSRSHVYWAARMQSQQALEEFAQKSVGASEAQLAKLKANLVQDSGLHMFDKQVVDEFMRRALISPDMASRYAGKQASDVINFLYGRGMQPRWMRGIAGRLLGQFGTWSLWYLDYLKRTTTNIAENSGKFAAGTFLARHALANAAVMAGGASLGLEMGRWIVYPAVFYSGGPGFSVAQGLSSIARGFGSALEGADSKYAGVQIQEGTRLIESTMPSLIPFRYAARDALQVIKGSPTERLAALLSVRVSPEAQAQRKLDLLLGRTEPFASSQGDLLDRMLNSAAYGRPEALTEQQIQGVLNPAQASGPQQQGQAASNGARQGQAPPTPPPPTVPPPAGVAMPQIPASGIQSPGESVPVGDVPSGMNVSDAARAKVAALIQKRKTRGSP